MPSTGKNNGTLFAIYKDGTKVTHSTNFSFDINADVIDVTTKDSAGWRELLSGLRSFSGSGDFLYSENGAVNFEDFFDEINTRSSFTARWTSNVSGDVYYEGTVWVTNLGMSGGVEDAMSYTLQVEGTGTITKSTI